MPAKIIKITAREILDSRGNPTVEVEVTLDDKISAKAAVASGASTGEFEALELRDGEMRYGGQGVLRACEHVNKRIAPLLIGTNASAQKKIDALMIKLDGTANKSELGANAILGVSLAVARAGALSAGKPLYKYLAKTYGFGDKPKAMPVPMFNILNGGKHADSGLCIQEFMVVPAGIDTSRERIRAGSEIFHAFKKILATGGYATGVGDEGGFAPRLDSIEKGIEAIMKAIANAGYEAGKDVFISLDAAANSFYLEKENQYVINPGNIGLDASRLTALYLEWISKYPILSLEDGLNEKDWKGWKEMKKKLQSGRKDLILVADDLTVTNPARVETAAKYGCANGIIIKPNQIGSLTETVECIQKAQALGWKIIVSHRSGETCDDFIADLAVASGADFIKSGSLSRGERLAKYNRLMEIETEIKGI